MEVKYKDWKEISIELYKKITEAQNEDVDIMTKEVMILAMLCECSEDDIWNLDINKVGELKSQLQFLGDFDFNKNKKYKSVKVGGIECDVCTDLNTFTYAQYVDFQNFYPQDGCIAQLLSTIIIPKGNKYNDGYDIADLIQKIEKTVDIVTANEICFFFLKKYVNSIKRMNLCLLGQLTMRKMLTKKKNPIYQNLQKAIENSKRTHSILTSALSKK